MAKKLTSTANCSCVARHFLTDSVDLIVNFLVMKLVRGPRFTLYPLDSKMSWNIFFWNLKF